MPLLFMIIHDLSPVFLIPSLYYVSFKLEHFLYSCNKNSLPHKQVQVLVARNQNLHAGQCCRSLDLSLKHVTSTTVHVYYT